ncbi:MAG TPA: ABC transporter ATP-binding protein [Chitinophagaceae bacterium]|nr:ABC transporter ATP-binding protein [Chitinophagaceae bacterium]
MAVSSSKKKIFDFTILRRVFHYVRPYRLHFFTSLILAILLALIAPVRPYLIQLTVYKATGKTVHTPGLLHWTLFNTDINNAAQFIFAVTVLQIVLLLVETTMRFFFTFLTSWLGQSVVKNMRVGIFDKILSLNLRQFDTTPIGTLTTRTINDIESINDIFSDGLIPIIADLLSIIVILVVMFVTDWRLSLISLIPIPLLIVATYYFKESVNKSFIRVRNAVAALNAFVQEHITGMQVVQAFAAEDREFAKFNKINQEHRNANIRSIFAYSIFFPVVEIVLAISMGLLVWWLAQLAGNNAVRDQNLAGELIAFILYLNLIFRPLRVIADKFNVLQMGMIAAERVFKVQDNTDVTPAFKGALETKPVISTIFGDEYPGSNAKSYPAASSPQSARGEVSFEHVWFAYADDNYVLKDISFHIQAGQTIALVGHTGSGKTSIISLLNRLYHIQKGLIKIDGRNIEEYDLDVLRSSIGVVLQDVFLFSGSVMDNITLRNPGIPKEDVIKAAKLIGVHDFIMQLPGGYSFNVMERGNTLSLGQRQLISFIRALLYNPSILILDEATSSIDTESEMLIQKAIDTLIAGRTSIVIAHRLSTIRKASKIIVLDKGEIKETGTHEELLTLGGLYSKLSSMQLENNKKVVSM